MLLPVGVAELRRTEAEAHGACCRVTGDSDIVEPLAILAIQGHLQLDSEGRLGQSHLLPGMHVRTAVSEAGLLHADDAAAIILHIAHVSAVLTEGLHVP